jgi:ZIP family zinc transporter
MLTALLFGLAASSALAAGGVAGAFWRSPRPLVAAALAFASGALITALAFDLFEESFETGGVWSSGVGLLVGAAAFVAADGLLDRYIEGAGSGVSGFAILAAVRAVFRWWVVLIGAIVLLLGLLGQAIDEVAPALLG